MNENLIIYAVGSNMNDRIKNLQKAIDSISNFSQKLAVSRIFETDALLKDDSPQEWQKNFLNIVVYARTNLSCKDFFLQTQSVEKDINSKNRVKYSWSPRDVDIDILYFNDDIINDDILTVPHKEIDNRSFVIYPLYDIYNQSQEMKLYKCPVSHQGFKEKYHNFCKSGKKNFNIKEFTFNGLF